MAAVPCVVFTLMPANLPVCQDGRVHTLYSTPGSYLDAKKAFDNTSGPQVAWPLKQQDDFFPYADDAHSYWTGA